MEEKAEDSLNSVLFGARNRLREIRESIAKGNGDFSTILNEIDDFSNELKEDSEKIENIPNEQAKVLPLVIAKANTPRKIKPKKQYPPKDEVKINNTKATLLKKKYTTAKRDAKKLPVLKGATKYMDASTLIARGIANESDDLSNVIPAVEPSSGQNASPLFPSLHMDIAGAARELKRKKILKEKTTARKITVSRADDYSPREIPKIEEEEVEKEPPKARVYEEIQDEYAYQTLLIVRGKIARETPDFESFKRTNESKWDKIETILSKIEQICAVYKLSYAEIDGRKLSEAIKLDNVDLMQALGCLIGVDDHVNATMQRAASIIQRSFRRYKENQLIKQRKTEFRAAMAIQEFWRLQKNKKVFVQKLKDRVESVGSMAAELSKTLNGGYKEIEQSPYIEVHVITSPLDLMRVFQLMYKNVQMMAIVHYLPHPHIWEDFLDFMAFCGIDNVNERINFITLKEVEGNNGISNRLLMDLRSLKNAKKLICGRNAFIVPHSDWDSERQLSVDLSIPILGAAEPEYLQSRSAITEVFQKAGIVTTLSTPESNNITILGIEAQKLMRKNKDLTRWIIRLGFTQTEDGIAWFDANREIMYSTDSFENILKGVISSSAKPAQFLKHISELGATIEAVPSIVYSFPSVSLLLTGNEIRVIGTFDRMHHSPYKFGAFIVPCVSVNSDELIAMGRAAGSELMKRGVIGYVCIDFLAFKEEKKTRIIGFDIRLNCYPSLLHACYLTLCAGYDETCNRMILLKGASNNSEQRSSVVRYAVIHSGLTHQGFISVGTRDVKKACFNQGLMFDLIQRTGFTTVFLDAPAEGKSFAISSGLTPESAISLFEKGYTFLGKYLSSKAVDESSTISRALISIRHFKTRFFK